MITPATLTVSDDSPRITGGGFVNNQITVTLAEAGAGRKKYCTFQVNRADLCKLVEGYAGDSGFLGGIPAKIAS